MYLPKKVTSHPQPWSCSAVLGAVLWKHAPPVHALYMASYNCDDTRMSKVLSSAAIEQFTLAETHSSPLSNVFPRPRPMVFTPQIAISDIIVGDSSVRASVARAVYSSAKHRQPKANRLARKENPLSPKNDLKHLAPSSSFPSSTSLGPAKHQSTHHRHQSSPCSHSSAPSPPNPPCGPTSSTQTA